MSGRKRILIDENEYRQLLENRERLRQIQSNLPEVLDAVRRESAAELRRRLEPIERRQQDLREALQGVLREVREFEEETAARIEEQSREMRRAIHDVRQEMQEQAKRFQRMVEQERKAREHQIRKLQEQIDSIVADQKRRAEVARAWIEAAEVMRDFIKGNYRHQQFAPGALQRLERDIQQARDNLEQGIPEAALAQAQAAYRDLSDLRLELEQLEREWNVWRAAALEGASEVLALAQRNRKCKAAGPDGQEIDVAIEVDYWTGGKLTAMELEVQQVVSRIRDEGTPMTTEDLRRIVEVEVPAFQERLEEVVWEARLMVLASQLRINIADKVVQALEEQGFQYEDGTYEAEDMRGAYVAKVRHLDGSEVVVVVTPKASDPATNEVSIHSYDVGQRSEHELRQRAQELARSLRAKGLEAGEPEAAMDARGSVQPEPGLRDLQRVRKQRIEEVSHG